MNAFLYQLKEETYNLRSGGYAKDISLGPVLSEIVLLRGDLLLPHWTEFAHGMHFLDQSDKRCDFSISNIQLTSNALELLFLLFKVKIL